MYQDGEYLGQLARIDYYEFTKHDHPGQRSTLNDDLCSSYRWNRDGLARHSSFCQSVVNWLWLGSFLFLAVIAAWPEKKKERAIKANQRLN
jgi:hypothetical protein